MCIVAKSIFTTNKAGHKDHQRFSEEKVCLVPPKPEQEDPEPMVLMKNESDKELLSVTFQKERLIP